MHILTIILYGVFIIDSFLLIIAILLQSGRGGGLAGALGGIGGMDSALGVRAISQIEKATGVLAAIFMVIALTLAMMGAYGAHSSTTAPVKTRDQLVTEPASIQAVTTQPAAAAMTPPTTGKK